MTRNSIPRQGKYFSILNNIITGFDPPIFFIQWGSMLYFYGSRWIGTSILSLTRTLPR
jgi:hypothetical protein